METMNIAIEGCCHGELDRIYETMSLIERQHEMKIDLLICCGDFQAVRNLADLQCMAVPPKYRQMQTFYKYYSGEKVAPVLTLFIGGNHEASNHLWELSYGGWVAPNIFYLGRSGLVKFAGLRIGGLSGIYKPHDYNKGVYESPPFDNSTCRSIYHVRSYDVFKLKLISGAVDIFLSHDWPRGVYHHGDSDKLLRQKSFLTQEVQSNSLGSPPAEELLHHMKPSYWFSAHLHVKFAAVVKHGVDVANEEERKETKFLALDKCLPRKDFLQVLSLPVRGEKKLEYDAEWLAITNTTRPLLSLSRGYQSFPSETSDEFQKYKASIEDIKAVQEAFGGDLTIPQNFSQIVPAYNPSARDHSQVAACEHPQTTEFCRKLGIENPFRPENSSQIAMPSVTTSQCRNPDEITLSDDNDDEPENDQPTAEVLPADPNPDEIDLGSDESDTLDGGNGCNDGVSCREESESKQPRLDSETEVKVAESCRDGSDGCS